MGGDREGRLLVSKCSTDNDLRMAGFHTIPPITFLQYWLLRDLKNQEEVHFLHRQTCSTRHYTIKETVSPHSLPGGGLVSTWVTPAKVTRNTGVRSKGVPFYPGLSLLFLRFWWKYFLGLYYCEQWSCSQNITKLSTRWEGIFRVTQKYSSSNFRKFSRHSQWHEYKH